MSLGAPVSGSSLQRRRSGITPAGGRAIRPAKSVSARPKEVSPKGSREIVLLKRELASVRDYMLKMIEEQVTANESLKSASEEILLSNEELQRAIDRLEVSKEALQTVNGELLRTNADLGLHFHEMIDLIHSINLPIVAVRRDLSIRYATRMAERTLNLGPADDGRRITEIEFDIEVPNLEPMLLDVIERATHRECAVRNREGRPYVLHLKPFRTSERRIDGAVLLFLEAGYDSRRLEPAS